jgi:putative oxidoreductase
MNSIQSLARPLLASMFVAGGIDSIRNSESKVKSAEAVVGPLSRVLPDLNSDTETLVRFNGAVQVGAGVLLATGKFRRLAALALIGSLVPTTYAGHRFWEETDEDIRKQQRTHFLKNLGLLGGLLLELDSRPRRPRRAHVQSSARVRSGSANLANKTKRLERRAERRARIVADQATKLASHAASDVAKGSHQAAKWTGEAAGQYATAASGRAGQLISYAQDQLSNLNT